MKHMLFPELDQLSQALSHSSQESTVHTRIEAYSCKPVKRDKKLSKAMETSFQEVQAEIKQSVGSPEEEDDALYASPFGHLNRPQSRKTLYLLIQLLNLAFPDYDFSEAKSDHFSKENNGMSVLHALSTTLESVRTQSGPHLVYAPRSYSAYPPSSSDFFSGSGTPLMSSSFPKKPLSVQSSQTLDFSPTAGLSPSTSPSQSMHLSTGLNPMLYQVLNNVICLDQCDVYAYTPDLESDPHADDSDSDADSDESYTTSEDESYDMLGFDDFTSSSSPPKLGLAINKRPPYGSWVDDVTALDGLPDLEHSGRSDRLRKTSGGLLWSSHYFFYNRKLKRILFVTIWAKKRRRWTGTSEDDSFSGWHGGVGAGARAMGLEASEA
ncbi:hypothetical protein FRB93_013968 [Tulasnella sp. JGI-2019a]|nr:hypothetical protein FRB93_013968 [Tulasnella sp. JGI-2019a]